MGYCCVAIQVLIMKMTSSATMKYLFSKPLVSLFALAGLVVSFPSFAMVEMKDEQLSDITGQALLQMGKTEGQGISSDTTFYKAGLDARLELNMNIEKLQLGCTSAAVNGKNCDIDIRNFSLSGLPSSYVTNPSDPTLGSPDFTGNDGRVATSASLSRPFFEFAIKNDHSKTLREVVGIRMGASEMLGLLSSGTANGNSASSTDGIQSLSGFMQIKETTGSASTEATLFGTESDHEISGLLNALGFDRQFTSTPGHQDTDGVSVPSLTTDFDVPSFTVNGKRQTAAVIQGITTKIDSISLSDGPENQLRVSFPCILLIACQAKIELADGSAIQNLNMEIDFSQSLSMIHNIPLTGTGFYLSMQGEDVKWPGAHQDDVARQGWWMSFSDEVDLGELNASNPVNIDSVLPQVATLMTAELLKEENRVYAPPGASLGTLFGITMTTPEPIIVDLDAATDPLQGGNPVDLNLSNLQLTSQYVTPNCWGSARFC